LIKKLMANFNPNHKIVLDNLLLANPLLHAGKMFGFPAYYVNNKLCICLYEQGVGVKLPASSVAALLENDPNSIPFQPLGKPKMREWVQINLDDSQAYAQYEAVFIESIRFVHEQQLKKKL